MWLAAARRFALLLVGASALVVVVSTLLGLAFGTSLSRAISLGFYLLGSFLLVAGFFMGSRGPARLRGEPGDEGPWGIGRRSGVRLATPEEHADAVATAGIFVTLGIVLVLLGVVVDDRFSVV